MPSPRSIRPSDARGRPSFEWDRDSVIDEDWLVISSPDRDRSFSTQTPLMGRVLSGLKRLHILCHSRSQIGVRKPTVQSAHVLDDVGRLRCRWNCACNERMGYDELEEELRPVRAVELPCVCWQ